ncbi:monomodular non-ribosomal peptide synthetase [Dothidotthia symphoricarpi CBS 119687]|uniref:Monomodular non-ribosomal peptide synthetase n=1 Tax=Dothidotthia symphoricarpi CBS 119687 TaxID=1392245 RepID=A0A6A6AID8_9PLEO|nr:monomodular non-ribosomal peptide synthetase [Dothidotthia symphoricarpi CBS 119687]KAF2131732.1 monomodular non-ribosomal peptide synthetase [Dothidotthia symphoricarpi CBS 119687]
MTIIDTTKDLSALFTQQVQATPDAVALEDDQHTYTYQQLHDKAAALADRLRGHGVGRDSLVGVLLPRSADYVIACLAALRAGGAFLVLELAYPPDLLADVLEDAQPTVVVTISAEVGKIKEGTPLVVLDEQSSTNGHVEKSELPPLPEDTDLDRLSFVAYSSGTTGKPKGIANPHRAAVLSYDLRFALSDLQPGDRVACNVFFVWEILRPLLRGATVVAVPDEASYDPRMLTLFTPTLFAAVLARHQALGSRLPNLKTIWLNGEVVTTDLARRGIKALPNTRIACGDIKDLLEKIDKDAPYCPVGAPLIDNKFIYILDESGQKVEEGENGELFVGGHMLARGYLNRPETTAKAFIPNPYISKTGARMYRTGDKARLLPSGFLEITGRVGAMIKIRGYSVVPGKVESAIRNHLAVSHCAVVAWGEGIDRQLVAYFVRDKDPSAERPVVEIDRTGRSSTARRMLQAFLAHYMLPSLWVELESLPTSDVSGKVNLKALPPPRPSSPTGSTRKFEQSPIAVEQITEIWASILSINASTITPEYNFFDLGGHSLLLADLSARLSNTFGFRVPVARLANPATLNGHLDTVRAIRDGHTAEVQDNLPAVLRADSILDKDIQPTDAKICALKDAKTVLLTGVTGFLGAFLLRDLMESTSATIICMVRFSDASQDDVPAGIARIRRNLLDFGLWNDSIMERVEILTGNLSRKRFGLSPDVFKQLADRVDVIVHAAATVNLVYPYAALQKPNVGGTREVLRLASQGGATVQYVSTNGVLPPASGREGWSEDGMIGIDDVPTKLADGYGQTKWVAEQLALEAQRRGLPIKIHRLGTISGHSETGAANAWDLLTALIVESIRIGYYPDVKGWRAEMTPVDFVSKAIIHLSSETQTDQTVFHIGDPDPVDISQVFDDLNHLGYPTQPLEFEKWVALWDDKRGSAKGGDGAFTVDILRSGMPSIEFLRDVVVLDNAKTRPLRSTVERPKVDQVLLETYTRHWYARGWLPAPPQRQDAVGGSGRVPRRGPLFGKVAIVMGASSGIGAATATALAREGCHVALAARRLDALEDLKKRLVIREGKIITQKTDITDAAQVAALVAATESQLGPVDIFVSVSGVMYFTMMANALTDQWNQTVDVNCKGLLNVISSVVPSMLKRGSGHLVAISSDAGRKVFPGLGVYSASKFFVEATLQALRVETAGSGLRVTSVQPGNVATDLLGMSTDQEALKKYGEPSGAKVLDPEDVAGSIVYALKQPGHVAVNEVMIEPRDEPI